MILREYNSLLEVMEAFPDEQSCIEFLEEVLWEGRPVSPFDEDSIVYRCKDNRYKCKNTGKYFTVLTDTMMENTKISLRKWLIAIWLITTHKKGLSSYQLARDLKVTQKTAWFLLQRIREGLRDDETVLEGEVEMDETFVGGKNKNRHRDKKVPVCRGRAHVDKTPVLGMLERGGRLVLQVIPDTSQRSITPAVLRRVRKGSVILTDEWRGYDKLEMLYHREFVDHGRKEYARGSVTTNRIEGIWGTFKRGIIGVYQMASRKHLQRYANEFAWRYNTRKMSQGQRFSTFFTNFDRRLRYKDLVYG